MNQTSSTARRFALLGATLVMLGLLTGLISGSLANPRMGLSAHLEGIMNGTLMLALAGGWNHVRLSPKLESWCFGLLAFGTLANWLATLLAAIWGAGRTMMPIATGAHQAAAWQEQLVTVMLLALSLAVIAGVALLIKGLLAPHEAKG